MFFIVNIMDKPQLLEDLCKQVLKLDKSIRFAGIADKFGKIVVSEYRIGTTPLLSKEEAILSAVRTVIIMGTRQALRPALGKIVYSFALYEKVKRATMPLRNQLVLLVSFDKEADHEPIILKKILPLVKEHDLAQ